MIVLDNSALVNALVSPEAAGSSVLRRISGEEVVAPHLIDIEAVSTLRGLVLGGKLDAARAERLVSELPALALRRLPHTGLLDRIWQLRDNLTPYDAAYVALAERLDVPLVTGDARIAAAPGLRCTVEVLR